jgi:undecaprenyl-diphosphatase
VSPTTRLHRRRLVSLWLAGAFVFALMAVCAALFDRFPGDERVAEWIQDIDAPGVATLFDASNWLGDPWPSRAIVAVLAVAFVFRVAPLAAALVVTTLAARGLNELLQELIDRPRPSEDLIRVTEHIDAGSFPSGHTVGTTFLFGVLFFLAGGLVPWRPARWAAQAGCLLVILAAGPARVYVGAHWPSDVIGGYLLAALLLALAIASYVELKRRGNVDSRP